MLDFVIAAIGLAFLGVSVSGLGLMVSASRDLVAISQDCAHSACTHLGTVIAAQRVRTPQQGLTGIYGAGIPIDVCVVTLNLEGGTRTAAVVGPLCHGITVPAATSVEIWRGTIIAITLGGRSHVTNQHPSLALVAGGIRLVALGPFALCFLLIEIDVMHHRHVWRVRHRFKLFRAPRPPASS